MYSGVIEGEGLLLLWQLADIVACFSWSFLVTAVLLLIIDRTPGLSLTLGSEDELTGIDAIEMGEATFDYLKLINSPKPKMKEIGTSPASQPAWGIAKGSEILAKGADLLTKTSQKTSKEPSDSSLNKQI
eukprot:NODE_983_length_2555_cov_0.219463.p2 type:complete len:130 gc:universal NODE_983_length_2555_cov_0.219463:971-582(-)